MPWGIFVYHCKFRYCRTSRVEESLCFGSVGSVIQFNYKSVRFTDDYKVGLSRVLLFDFFCDANLQTYGLLSPLL